MVCPSLFRNNKEVYHTSPVQIMKFNIDTRNVTPAYTIQTHSQLRSKTPLNKLSRTLNDTS